MSEAFLHYPDSHQEAPGVAAAPGHMPLAVIMEREALKARQFRHDNTVQPAAPTPADPIQITATSGAALAIARAELWYTTDGGLPGRGARRLAMAREGVEWSPHTGYLQHWMATIPPQAEGTTIRYQLVGYSETNQAEPDHVAHDGAGFWYRYGAAGITTFACQVRQQPRQLPAWLQDAVIYHIFLDRFNNPQGWPQDAGPLDRHGGTLAGVRQALPYLAELGVNCLLLSPLGPSPSYHRYDQLDYFAVDPELGDLAALRELVAAAHAQGLRLLLDFVPSHCSAQMPAFLAAQADREAPTASWFTFYEWPGRYRCFLEAVPSLVALNGNAPGLRRFLLESARFWIGDVGFDGLRLDHSIGQGLDFWLAFCQELERIRPDVALIGEATDTPDNLRRQAGRLPGLLDFPLATALRFCFGSAAWDGGELLTFLGSYGDYMAAGPGRVTFFDNHDMDRLLFLARGDRRRLKLAALCLLTLPYPPILYYGTEIGLNQPISKDEGGYGGDHIVRGDMPWEPAQWDQELRAYFRRLVALRRSRPALRRGRWQPLAPRPGSETWGYRLLGDAETLSVYFNLGEEAGALPAPLPTGATLLLATGPEPVSPGRIAAGSGQVWLEASGAAGA